MAKPLLTTVGSGVIGSLGEALVYASSLVNVLGGEDPVLRNN